MGYQTRGLILRTRDAIPLRICGETDRSAQTYVCLLQGSSMILLVVQEDKIALSPKDAQAQVIAEATAAFQYNNTIREQLGQPELSAMTTLSFHHGRNYVSSRW